MIPRVSSCCVARSSRVGAKRFAGGHGHAVPAPAPAKPTVSPQQLGEKLLAELLAQPTPFTRDRFRQMVEKNSRSEVQAQLAALKAVAPKLNVQEELNNDPTIVAALRAAQDSMARLQSYDPARELRERASAALPLPKPGQVPSPRYFFELMRAADEEGATYVKARALEAFVEVSRGVRALKERAAARKTTDVSVEGTAVPAEVAESVPVQAYLQAADGARGQLRALVALLDRSVAEVDALHAETKAEKDNLHKLTIEDIARQHPTWAREAFEAQEQHRWFERALDEEEGTGGGKEEKH